MRPWCASREAGKGKPWIGWRWKIWCVLWGKRGWASFVGYMANEERLRRTLNNTYYNTKKGSKLQKTWANRHSWTTAMWHANAKYKYKNKQTKRVKTRNVYASEQVWCGV